MFSRSKKRSSIATAPVKRTAATVKIIEPEYTRGERKQPLDLSTARVSIIGPEDTGLMINVKEDIEGEEDE